MIVVDIETPQWFNMPQIKHLLREKQLEQFEVGVAVTGVATRSGINMSAWRGDEIEKLVAHLVEHQPIAGWNILDFDIPVIQNQHRRATGERHAGLDAATKVDLFAVVREMTGRWYKLEEVAQANLGRGKTADGLQASEWLRAGNWDAAANYCTDDVQLEADLLEQAMGPGMVLPYYNKRGVTGHKKTIRIKSIEWAIE